MASRGVGSSSGKYKFVKPKTKHVVERIIFGMSSNKIDPNLVSLGQKYCVAIIEEKIPTGVILRGDCSREIVDLAYVDKKSEAGSGLFFTIVFLLAALFLWSIYPFVSIILVLFCCVLGGVTAFMHAEDKYKKNIIRNYGPTEQGSVCTLIPKHNLILDFTWFGKEIFLSVCEKIPDDYYVSVGHEERYSGGDHSTYTWTDNKIYLKSKSQRWRFFLGIWKDIESEEEAIERVSKENWRNYLRAPMVFGEKQLISYDQKRLAMFHGAVLLLAYVIWSWLG